MSRKMTVEESERRTKFTISGKAGDLSLRELEAMVAYGEVVAKDLRKGKLHPHHGKIWWDRVKEMMEASLGFKI